MNEILGHLLLIWEGVSGTISFFTSESKQFQRRPLVGTTILTSGISAVILQIRIYAMYGRSKKILTLLLSLFLPTMTLAIFFIARLLRDQKSTSGSLVSRAFATYQCVLNPFASFQ